MSTTNQRVLIDETGTKADAVLSTTMTDPAVGKLALYLVDVDGQRQVEIYQAINQLRDYFMEHETFAGTGLIAGWINTDGDKKSVGIGANIGAMPSDSVGLVIHLANNQTGSEIFHALVGYMRDVLSEQYLKLA